MEKFMNRSEIINEVVNNGIIEKYARSITFKDLYYKEEFIQLLYLILCEIPEDKLIKLYKKKELYFYLIKICKNQFFNKYSTFNSQMEFNDRAISLDNFYSFSDEEEEINSGLE